MKFPKTLLIFSLSLFIVFYYTSCKTNTSTAPENKISTVNEAAKKLSKSLSSTDKLKKLAKGLAILLKDENYRTILQKEINASKNYEQILIAPEFFNKIKDAGKLGENERQVKIGEKISNFLTGREKEELDYYIKTLVKGVVDIYFPFHEHRKNYSADQEVLVAPVTKSLIKNNELIAYNSNGEEVVISSKEPNKIPTLVVCFSEKGDIYTKEEAIQNNLQYAMSIQSTEVPTTPTIWYMQVGGVTIENNYDGGILGDMEIWARAANQMYSSSDWSGWHGSAHDNHAFGTIPANQYTSLNVNIGCAYFPSAQYIVELWEHDDWYGGGSDDLVADSNWNDVYAVSNCGSNTGSHYGDNVHYLPWSVTPLRLHDSGGSGDNDYLWVYGITNLNL